MLRYDKAMLALEKAASTAALLTEGQHIYKDLTLRVLQALPTRCLPAALKQTRGGLPKVSMPAGFQP